MSPVNVPAIGAYIREQREQAKISLRQLAQATGVSNPYLSQIERGLRKPSADILQQLAKGLRISAEALYVQAGRFLEDRPEGYGVREAVLAAPELSERQKQMLLEIYDRSGMRWRRTPKKRRMARTLPPVLRGSIPPLDLAGACGRSHCGDVSSAERRAAGRRASRSRRSRSRAGCGRAGCGTAGCGTAGRGRAGRGRAGRGTAGRGTAGRG